MAQHTKHPVSAPPTAPERESTGHLLLRGYAILVFIVVLAPAAWQNAFGPLGAGVVGLIVAIGTVSIGVPRLLRLRADTPFPWRRLPWTALGYVAMAVLSILWSAWPATTALTSALLLGITVQALFLAVWLTWRDLLRALASALKWVIGLSLVFELYVSLIVQGPLLPNFVTPPTPDFDPQWYWSRDNLFDGGRLQGIVGNANLLGALCLLALIVFAIRLWAGAPRRSWLIAWIVVTSFLFVRAGSATAVVCALGVTVVAATVLIMRRVQNPRARRPVYLAFFGIGLVGLVGVWLLRVPLLSMLGRSTNLTGREGIWEDVLARAVERPWVGWGHASPWMPWDPQFDGWIIDKGMTVMQAHNMWVDAFFQLGAIGVALVAVALVTFLWRAWFFAVDRPRWDLRADRPYSPVTILPILVGTMLLIQGITESGPLMLWGWLLLIMLTFKIKSVPFVGVGLSEQSPVVERGGPRRRVP
ncbi:MAG: O-antigen ligase family protein [Actinomycetota bacterium]